MSVFDVLQERGFIAQVSHEEEIRELLEKEKVTFYIGFDPTADSLHVGHFIALMAMAHMQRAGHRPIALLGGGTGMIGDPSGKDDMRKMLTPEFINQNHMLAAECYKKRWDKGLTFFEFNYMIMQAYDFYTLHKNYNCVLEMGGDDQWSNMLAGVELIRRKDQKPAFCITCKLLTTSDGRKMGKTEKGALWLDAEKCSPYDFYQYWRNVDDSDVEKCLALLTFLPMEEVRRLGAYKDEKINEAKKVLAYEVTKLIHGQAEADKAVKATEAREARQMIAQRGLYLNNAAVEDAEFALTPDLFAEDGGVLIRKGKKKYYRIVVK